MQRNRASFLITRANIKGLTKDGTSVAKAEGDTLGSFLDFKSEKERESEVETTRDFR